MLFPIVLAHAILKKVVVSESLEIVALLLGIDLYNEVINGHH